MVDLGGHGHKGSIEEWRRWGGAPESGGIFVERRRGGALLSSNLSGAPQLPWWTAADRGEVEGLQWTRRAGETAVRCGVPLGGYILLGRARERSRSFGRLDKEEHRAMRHWRARKRHNYDETGRSSGTERRRGSRGSSRTRRTLAKRRNGRGQGAPLASVRRRACQPCSHRVNWRTRLHPGRLTMSSV